MIPRISFTIHPLIWKDYSLKMNVTMLEQNTAAEQSKICK